MTQALPEAIRAVLRVQIEEGAVLAVRMTDGRLILRVARIADPPAIRGFLLYVGIWKRRFCYC